MLVDAAVQFYFEGHLKSFDSVRYHGLIRCARSSDVWFGQSDVVTENPSLSAGSSVRFELYYGSNGKPTGRRVEIGTIPNGTEFETFLGRVTRSHIFCFVVTAFSGCHAYCCTLVPSCLIHLCARLREGLISFCFGRCVLKTFHLGTVCVYLAWSSPLPRCCCCVDCLYCDLILDIFL